MENKSKKYALYPVVIMSQSDGEFHHISAHQLASLYNVPAKECVIRDFPLVKLDPSLEFEVFQGKCSARESALERSIERDKESGLLVLHPLFNGRYYDASQAWERVNLKT